MAGPTVKEILLKWGIDNSNWKSAITDLGKLLDQQTAKSQKAQTSALKSLQAQKDKISDLVSARKSETAEIQRQITALKTKASQANTAKAQAAASLAQQKTASQAILNSAKQQTAAAAAQVAQQRQIAAAQKTIQAGVNAQITSQKLVTAQIQTQTAQLRQQALIARQQQIAQRKPGGGGGHGGHGGGGFLGSLFGGLPGAGIVAQMTSAVAAGELFAHVLEKIIDKFAEMMKSISPMGELKEQFEKLSASAGIEPTQFINDLRKATQGLVQDTNLYRNANLFLQSGVHASQSDIVKLTEATVGLARAQGKEAPEAINALNRFFLTGRAQTLAWVTGIQRGNFEVAGLAKGVDQATRSGVQFKQALAVLTQQFAAIGQPALSYKEVLDQVENSVTRILQQFTLGLVQSDGFKAFLKSLSEGADWLGKIADKAADFGAKFGVAFSVALEVAKVFFDTLEEIGSTLMDTWRSLTTVIQEALNLFGNASTTDDFTTRLTTLKGVVVTLGQAVTLLVGGIRELVNVTRLLTSLDRIDQAWKKFKDREKIIGDSTMGSIENQNKSLTAPAKSQEYELKFAAPTTVQTEEQQIAAEKKIAKVKEEIAIETAKILLTQTQTRIQKEEELLQVQYEQGLLTIKEFLDKKADLEKQDHEAKLKQLKSEYEAKAQYTRIESEQQRTLAEERIAQAKADQAMRELNLQSLKADLQTKLAADTTKTPEEKKKIGGEIDEKAEAYSVLLKNSAKASIRMAQADLDEVNAKNILDQKKYQADREKENEEYAKKGR